MKKTLIKRICTFLIVFIILILFDLIMEPVVSYMENLMLAILVIVIQFFTDDLPKLYRRRKVLTKSLNIDEEK